MYDLRIQTGSIGYQCASWPQVMTILLCDVLWARPKPGEQDTFTEVLKVVTLVGLSKLSQTSSGGQVISVTNKMAANSKKGS